MFKIAKFKLGLETTSPLLIPDTSYTKSLLHSYDLIAIQKDSKYIIPATSLKGKLKYLFAIKHGFGGTSLKDLEELPATLTDVFFNWVNVFGCGADLMMNLSKKGKLEAVKSKLKIPARVFFNDLVSTKEINKEAPFENKTSVSIDRFSLKANDGSLLQFACVPRNTPFEGVIEILYKNDEELKSYVAILKESLEMLNTDYLGRGGSRGMGRVKVLSFSKEE